MAGTIFIRGEGGGIHELSLPLHETIEDQLRKGLSVRVNADGEAYEHVAGEDQVPSPPGERPANRASKADWIGWAVANGASVDDAEALTKQDLIDMYGHDAPAPAESVESEDHEPLHAAE